MGKYWNPADYTIEDQIREMAYGRDVATSGNDVLKGNSDGSVSLFTPSGSDRGHMHIVFPANGGKGEVIHG